MNINRRHLLVVVVAGLLGPASLHVTAGQYPQRCIKVIVPYSAGGITDVQVRRVAERLGPALGQPIIVENRPGASGTVGFAAGATTHPAAIPSCSARQATSWCLPPLGCPLDMFQ
jgi:tripartite-type tricarboxylate transporter receptor subunit TctC